MILMLTSGYPTRFTPDYKGISDRYDRQLVLDDLLMQSLIKQAVDRAIQFDNDPEKYYKYLDYGELIKVQAISNFTMKNKLELISKGFMVYKIKQHIEYLREQENQKENKIGSSDREVDISSRLSFLPKSNPTPERKVEYQSGSNEPEDEEYNPEYLSQNDLVIGMNGRPIKKYLYDIEKKLGKPLSTL